MISSRNNRKLKTMRRLRRCKGEHVLLEGPHLIEEALRARIELDDVMATPEFLAGPHGRRLAARLERHPTVVARPLLDELADADSPRGVLGLGRLPRSGCEELPARAGGLTVLVQAVQDPSNLGAVARVAEAAGADALALTPGSVHPNHPRALRASAGSLLRLPAAVEVTLDALLAHLGPLRPRLLALAAHGGRSLHETPIGGTLVVAVGSEGRGLDAELLDRADERVTIPLAGAVESLNVAVAAGIALFDIQRRRRD